MVQTPARIITWNPKDQYNMPILHQLHGCHWANDLLQNLPSSSANYGTYSMLNPHTTTKNLQLIYVQNNNLWLLLCIGSKGSHRVVQRFAILSTLCCQSIPNLITLGNIIHLFPMKGKIVFWKYLFSIFKIHLKSILDNLKILFQNSFQNTFLQHICIFLRLSIVLQIFTVKHNCLSICLHIYTCN